MIATTIQQSLHLFELGLDPKTADMSYTYFDEGEPLLDLTPYMLNSRMSKPAWSLSALLDVMPKGVELIKMFNDAGVYYEIDFMYTGYEDKDHITAAYEMVVWMLEQGYIKKANNEKH